MSKKRRVENEAAFAAVNQTIKSFKDLKPLMEQKAPRFKFNRKHLEKYGLWASWAVLGAAIVAFTLHKTEPRIHVINDVSHAAAIQHAVDIIVKKH